VAVTFDECAWTVWFRLPVAFRCARPALTGQGNTQGSESVHYVFIPLAGR
jgi:hypothetical protein